MFSSDEDVPTMPYRSDAEEGQVDAYTKYMVTSVNQTNHGTSDQKQLRGILKRGTPQNSDLTEELENVQVMLSDR